MASSDQAGCVYGVHLVGSIRLPGEPDDPLAMPPSPRSVFQTMSEALPCRLHRMPDGETGTRHYFVNWQERAFLPSPWLFNDRERMMKSLGPFDPDETATRDFTLGSTGYDECAIASYSVFAELQHTDIIPANVRFQVNIPTPVNVLTRFVRPECQAMVEPKYIEQLLSAIHNIQKHIPPEKLAIQFDCALEFAILEGVAGPGNAFKPWFEVSSQALADRILGLTQSIHKDTQLGFHLCYGDLGHRHFVEPKDTSKLVEMANLLLQQSSHSIDFIHLPVPKDRNDYDYFAPLKQLQLPSESECALYLGLVHPDDQAGTKQRIETAQKVVHRFGIASECGWGRTPVRDVSSILQILKEYSSPV